MRIYPAIDIRNGRCTQLFQGDMGKAREYGDPVEMALRWQAEGAEYLHVVDLNAAIEGTLVNKDIVKKIVKAVKIPVQMGGGIRTIEDVRERLEDVGVSRVVMGTVACEQPKIVDWALDNYSENRIVVGIDAKEGRVATKGWLSDTDTDPVELALDMKKLGVKTIIYTDISKDGTLTGPSLEKITEMVKKTWINIIASGGMHKLEDIQAVRGTGACGVIIGTALYEGKIDLKKAMEAAE